MVNITTSSGFSFDVSENILKDWRLIKLLSKIRATDDEAAAIDAMSDVLGLILRENEERFYQHLMDDDGVVTSTAVMNEAWEIIKSIGDKKKNF